MYGERVDRLWASNNVSVWEGPALSLTTLLASGPAACMQVKSVRPVVMYRKHSQRRVASAQPSDGGSRGSRQLLSAALAPPQATKLYNGNATRAYNVNMELGVTGTGVAVGIIDTGTDVC